MYSTGRTLSTICFILCVMNIAGLVLLAILSMGISLPFYVVFTAALYLVSATVISLLLTLAFRNFLQDANIDSENNSMRLKKLNDRIHILETKK